MRDLSALSVRHGGLGIINPVSSLLSAQQASIQLTAPLVADIVPQVFRILEIKASIRLSNRARQKQQAEAIYDLPPHS
jgi:hypothetical protein